jgi:ankyrin repeat protein
MKYFSNVSRWQHIINELEWNPTRSGPPDLEKIKHLIAAGVDLNAQDTSGNTVIHLCCYYNHDDALQLFIKAGADLNIQDKNGDTGLMIAASKQHDACADMLLDADADPFIHNNDNKDFFGIFLEVIEQRGKEIAARGRHYRSALRNAFDDTIIKPSVPTTIKAMPLYGGVPSVQLN